MSQHLKYLRQFYMEQPYEISLETYALCNAACTFCPYPTLERKGTKMELGHIYKLIDEMQEFPQPFYFSPFKVNEPLLDERFNTICRAVNQAVPYARLRIFTNGSPLTLERIEEIAALENVEHLWISLNAIEVEPYKKLMGLNFTSTARRLDELHKCVDNGTFPHKVCVSHVVSNHEQPAKFIRYLRERWPFFVPQHIKQDGWLGFVPPMYPNIPATPCVRWFELSILATGRVSLCCMDGLGAFSIGDTHAMTLAEIYNAPAWRDRREAMISRTAIYPCSTCTY